jgi:hypothetical protein
MQTGGGFAQPLESNEWLTGLFLLILTATPIATILALLYEEAGSGSMARPSVAVRHMPDPPVAELPAKAVRTPSGTKLGPIQPAS